jgi:hypothetical protein
VHGAVAHVKPAALRAVLPPAGHESRAVPCAVNPAGHLKSHPPPAATEGWHALASTLGLMVLAVTVHGAAGWADSASRCSSNNERHILNAAPGLFCSVAKLSHTSEASEGTCVELGAGAVARQLRGRLAVRTKEAAAARQRARAADPDAGAADRDHIGPESCRVKHARRCIQGARRSIALGHWSELQGNEL